MNRQEMLDGLSEVAVGCGIAAHLTAIESEPKPLLLVFTIDRPVSDLGEKLIREGLEKFVAKYPELPPCIVLRKGLSLEAVLDPRG